MRSALAARLTRPAQTFVLGLLAALTLSGCLSKPALVTETFALEGPIESKPAPADGPVLVIQRVAVSPIFQGREFVYRKGDHQFERDGYAHFLVAPERMLEAAIADYMTSSGVFRSVVSTGRGNPEELRARFEVMELSGDFRDPANPKAVLEIACAVTRDLAPGNQVSAQKSYRRTRPISTKSAPALADGWNSALAEMMAEVANDLRSFASGTKKN